MKKIISPCLCKVYTSSGNEATARAFCKIQFENGRLSITGVIGPLRSGGYRGSAGQCVDEIREGCPCDEWTREMLDKFCSIWDEWHLNDMRPVSYTHLDVYKRQALDEPDVDVQQRFC